MKRVDDRVFVSPTDLAYFLACPHRTALEMAEAAGVIRRPAWDDPLLEALFALGLAHERQYVDSLQARARTLVDLADVRDRREAVTRTLEAMRRGVEVIVQAALAHEAWYGRPDVLVRRPEPSPRLGAWSYEVADTKLARETRGGTILQLGLYCELLEAAQGRAPERFFVVTPGDDGVLQVVRAYRVEDYAAYFRLLRRRLLEAVEAGHERLAAAHYPEPVDHCDICAWSPICRDRRRRDDHLSLVAGISRLQRHTLEAHDVSTVEALATVADPLPFRPNRGSIEAYRRVRDQARLQVETRRTGRVAYELIPPPPMAGTPAAGAAPPPWGLARLPEPSPGDVFLDLEGDPLALSGDADAAARGESGREYLFGLVTVNPDGTSAYRAWWADTAADERQAFEEVVDLILDRWHGDAGMHVYHYAPYEPSALKRLMGRYATREREIDQLLRGRRFIDLYAVVRQGVRVGVERYSIKHLEPLYAFRRAVDLREANRALRTMEQALELGRSALVTPAIRAAIEGYNRDDCLSTRALRDWLEGRRADLIAGGTPVLRPSLESGEQSRDVDEKTWRVEALRTRLLASAPADVSPSSPAWADHLVAYALDFHRREEKAGWWEYFRLRESPEDDLLDEPAAVAGLAYVGDVATIKRSAVQRYRYPAQEVEIRRGATLKTQDGRAHAELVALDRRARTIDMKVGPSKQADRPTSLFAHDHVDGGVVEQALFDLGVRVAEVGGVARLDPCPERALLLRERPTLLGDPPNGSVRPFDPVDGESATDFACRIVTDLHRTTLAIQGPPGAGKTYTGARMVAALLAAGRKVGVAATSHKVIRHLLDAVAAAAIDRGVAARLGHKDKDRAAADDRGAADDGEDHDASRVRRFTTNDEAAAALADGTVNVLGGTAWLWARPEFAHAVDVLFVDEAGQMALANVLGMARAAGSLVLLGDPQQLEQPLQGSHPAGVGVSALQHVLGEAQTMPPGLGLFLPETFRLAPALAAYTSEIFYAGALRARPGLDVQQLAGTGRFDGSGLRVVGVDHDGNRNASDEEAEAVARIVSDLLAPGARWTDAAGESRPMTAGDVRVVAPFNAHVARIEARLADSHPGVPVGTVDRFQGQEAAVSIYAMGTSRPEDAPRGLEFLYSLNRLNVATSRARCVAILVASPRLFEPACRTPRQMRLANALCRFRERAEWISFPLS